MGYREDIGDFDSGIVGINSVLCCVHSHRRGDYYVLLSTHNTLRSVDMDRCALQDLLSHEHVCVWLLSNRASWIRWGCILDLLCERIEVVLIGSMQTRPTQQYRIVINTYV